MPYQGFWHGYNEQAANNDAATGAALSSFAKIDALQQQQRARQALAESNGDVGVAIKRLVSIGDVKGAHELGQLEQYRAAAEARQYDIEHKRMLDDMLRTAPNGEVRPDDLDRLAITMGIRGSPGASAVAAMAQRRRDNAEFKTFFGAQPAAPVQAPAEAPSSVDDSILSAKDRAFIAQAPEAERAALTNALKMDRAGKPAAFAVDTPGINAADAYAPPAAAPGTADWRPSRAQIAQMLQSGNERLRKLGEYYDKQDFQRALLGDKQAFTRETQDRQFANSQRLAELRGRQGEALARLKKDLSGGAALSAFDPAETQFLAEQLLNGDTSVMQNLGRGAQGAENVAAIRKAAVRIARERWGDQGPAMAAQRVAEAMGNKAAQRALGTRAANFGLAHNEALATAELVEQYSAAFPRTEFVPINKLWAMVAEGTGNVQIKQLDAAINSLVQTYSRAMAPTGVAPLTAQEHARALMRTVNTHAQLVGVVNTLKAEMERAGASVGKTRDDIREEAVRAPASAPAAAGHGGSPTPAPQTQPAPATQAAGPSPIAPNLRVGDVFRGHEYLGGDPRLPSSWKKVP